jgi:hypothetical protein
MINSVTGVFTGNSERTRMICCLSFGKLSVWRTSSVAKAIVGNKNKTNRDKQHSKPKGLWLLFSGAVNP